MNIKQKLISENNPQTKAFLFGIAGIFSIMINFNRAVINLSLAGSLAMAFTLTGFYYGIASLLQAHYYWDRFRFVDKFFKAFGFFFMILIFLGAGRLIFAVFFHAAH